MSELIVGNMWTAHEEIGVSEHDGPALALLDEGEQSGALWEAEWSTEYSMWYLRNIVTEETRWDEWLYVNREKGGTRGAERSFWWNSRTGVSSWYPPKDPTRRTRACCWQRFVDKCLIAIPSMSLYYIAKLDKDGIENLKRFEDNRGVELEAMD